MMKAAKSLFTPPLINGVSASKVFLPNDVSELTIFEYLCVQFPHIQAIEWQQRSEDGLIYASDGMKLSIQDRYTPNTFIFYYRFLAHEIHVPFEHQILFEDEHLLVVDKPHFLTMSPTGQYVQETLLVRLKKQTGYAELTPIHRLDRETAGVVLFCKKAESRGIYQQLFAERKVQKTYHAIAAYRPEIKFPMSLELQHAKYQLSPKTGKQHQLRVHLNHLNIPILNDPFYPIVLHKADDDFNHPLQLLAKEINFIDPISNLQRIFRSNHELTL